MMSLFSLGQIVATPGALAILDAAGVDPLTLIGRHVMGDWGTVSRDDGRENEFSVEHGYRIISSYPIGAERVWLITEADRSVTTLLRPCEY